jgi:uncharacterized protein YigA (DUF484 family)
MEIINNIGKYLQPNRAWFNRDESTIKKITVHHDAIPHNSNSADANMRIIMNTHAGNGWPGAAYHYYIHRDGKVYQLNRHSWVTWHDGHNYDSIAILVTGYFHTPHNNRVTAQQKESLFRLLDKLKADLKLKNADIVGHRDRMASACPGDLAYPLIAEYKTTPPLNLAYTMDTDIPSDIEKDAELHSIPGYDKYMTFIQFLRWASKRIRELIPQLNEANKKVKDLETKLEKQTKEYAESLRIANGNLDNKITELREVEKKLAILKATASQNELLKAEVSKLTSENASLEEVLEKANGELDAIKKTQQGLTQSLELLSTALSGVKRVLNTDKPEEFEEKIQNLLIKIETLEEKEKLNLGEFTVGQKFLSILLDILSKLNIK